jgi:hypothetical protein
MDIMKIDAAMSPRKFNEMEGMKKENGKMEVEV